MKKTVMTCGAWVVTLYIAIPKYIEQSCISRMNQPPIPFDYVDFFEAAENQYRSRVPAHAERVLECRERSLALRGMDWNNTFPNLEDKAPRRVHNDQRARVQTITRPGPKNGPDYRRNKIRGYCSLGRRTDQIARRSPKKNERPTIPNAPR